MIRKFYLLLLILVLPCICITGYAGDSNKQVDYPAVVQQINQLGDDLVNQYVPKDGLSTMDGFSKLYFDHYEGSGMELAVAAVSPTLNIKTEGLFTQLIGYASSEASPQILQKTWAALKIRLNADLDLLQNNTASNFTQAFLQAFSILLREGFEALIIITALLAYLRRSQHADKSYAIYYGVGSALLGSVITAYFFATVFKNLGANREAIEGIVMLIAATVLFYVSYWLFSKREAEKWQGFIKQKMNKALISSNLFALGLTAFLAVYREGAETILFYQALIIGSKGQALGITTGFVAACCVLLLGYRAMQAASFKIPYRLFFTITAIFLYYMSFSFIGGGILELQVAGWIDITPINGFPQFQLLGIFPAWENLGTQLVFLTSTLGALYWWYKRQITKRTLLSANNKSINL